MSALLEVRDLKTWFPVRSGLLQRVQKYVKAVDGVSLGVDAGKIVSVVGESGCGKSTLGNSILGLVPPTEGEIRFEGKALNIRKQSSWTPYRRHFQIVFQDPYSSLNPRHTIYEILSEPMLVHGLAVSSDARDKVAHLLERVGLSADYMDRFPHAFSGGQRQRIGIARAIGLEPRLLICDEVVSALDVSVQAQIIQLLMDLKREMNLAMVFISHDLSLVRAISDEVHVMYLGRVVEAAPGRELFRNPRHPYTRALLDSIPTLERGRRPRKLEGDVPSPVDRPKGCHFQGRCPRVQPRCRELFPPLEQMGEGKAACYYPLEGATSSTPRSPTRG